MPHILVVEDNVLQLMERTEDLRDKGFEVSEGWNVASAYEAYLENSPHINLVLTDCDFPGGGAGELIKRIKQHNPDMPVIVVTGTKEVWKATLSNPEFRPYLENVPMFEKPLQMSSVVSKIWEMIEAPHRDRDVRATAHSSSHCTL